MTGRPFECKTMPMGGFGPVFGGPGGPGGPPPGRGGPPPD
jgi:hypothetical protein